MSEKAKRFPVGEARDTVFSPAEVKRWHEMLGDEAAIVGAALGEIMDEGARAERQRIVEALRQEADRLSTVEAKSLFEQWMLEGQFRALRDAIRRVEANGTTSEGE